MNVFLFKEQFIQPLFTLSVYEVRMRHFVYQHFVVSQISLFDLLRLFALFR